MQKTIRLHRQHDMDLISLYRTEGFRFSSEMKHALRSCATGKIYRIHVPNKAYKCGYVKRSILLHISLDDEADSDIIHMLKNVRPGQCNSFMKAAFRNCLDYIPVRAYGKGSGFTMSLDEAQNLADQPLIPEPERVRYEKGERPSSIKSHKTRNDDKSAMPADLQKKKDREYSTSEKTDLEHTEYNSHGNRQFAKEIYSQYTKVVPKSEHSDNHSNEMLGVSLNNDQLRDNDRISENNKPDIVTDDIGLPFDEEDTLEHEVDSLTNDSADVSTVDDLDELFTQMSMLAH